MNEEIAKRIRIEKRKTTYITYEMYLNSVQREIYNSNPYIRKKRSH